MNTASQINVEKSSCTRVVLCGLPSAVPHCRNSKSTNDSKCQSQTIKELEIMGELLFKFIV